MTSKNLLIGCAAIAYILFLVLICGSDNDKTPPSPSSKYHDSYSTTTDPTINSYERHVFDELEIISDEIEETPSFIVKRRALVHSLNISSLNTSYLNINRKEILKSSFDNVMKLPNHEFKKNKLDVHFYQENGIDDGGLTKDWLDLIIKVLLNDDTGLFKCEENQSSTWPVDYDTVLDRLSHYNFLGKIMARIIIEGINVNVYLPEIIYKQILNLEIENEDFRKADPEFYEGLMKLRDIDDLEGFFVTYEEDELITKDNLEEYIEKKLRGKFVDSIKNQVDRIRTGFFEIIEPSLLVGWKSEELKLLICGRQYISVEDWRLHTTYTGFSRDDIVILWFWNILGRLNEKEKSKLLRFVTGLSRVPVGRFQNITCSSDIHFRIKAVSKFRVPISHTCSNTIEIYPYYYSEELLEDHLRLCMASSQGQFDIV